jgi:hypothetical protein
VQDLDQERWRELCDQVKTERNPEKLRDLVKAVNRLLGYGAPSPSAANDLPQSS